MPSFGRKESTRSVNRLIENCSCGTLENSSPSSCLILYGFFLAPPSVEVVCCSELSVFFSSESVPCNFILFWTFCSKYRLKIRFRQNGKSQPSTQRILSVSVLIWSCVQWWAERDESRERRSRVRCAAAMLACAWCRPGPVSYTQDNVDASSPTIERRR